MDRQFTEARKEQGFKSQAHLDAFFAAYDHKQNCDKCSRMAGQVWLVDGPQWYAEECPEGRRLTLASWSF